MTKQQGGKMAAIDESELGLRFVIFGKEQRGVGRVAGMFVKELIG